MKYQVWLVKIDKERLPVSRLNLVFETDSFADARAICLGYQGPANQALDITRNGRYVSW